MRSLRVSLALIMVLTAAMADASFRAADLVVVPVAASLPGFNDSFWRTDIEIMNVDSVPVDVLVVFLPTGGANNSSWFRAMGNHLGGRSSEGVGYVDERLAGILPGSTVIIENVIAQHWGTDVKGALLVFAYEAGSFGSTDPPGGVPKKVIVRSRTYDYGVVEVEEVEYPATYGQAMPGIPWYFYVDPGLEEKGLNRVVFSGITEDDDYRTAVGIVNISDPQTTVNVGLTLTDSDGNVLDEAVEIVRPLAHVQYDHAVRTLFFVDQVDVVGATLSARVFSWSSTAAEPTPALIVYVSRVDNSTNDPVYLEQAFEVEFPWDCVFNGNCSAASALRAGQGTPHVRPLQVPAP